MQVYAEKSPNWLQRLAPSEFENKELLKIVIFFVFHSPCEGLSAMGKSLQEYGWSDPWNKPFCLNKQLKEAASNSLLQTVPKNYGEMSEKLDEANLNDQFPSDFSNERICVYNNKKNQFLSVFYHLRNAFAHGRLNMFDVNGECVFAFEDVTDPKTLKVSARMILKRSTLLKWIDIIEGGEKEYQKQED